MYPTDLSSLSYPSAAAELPPANQSASLRIRIQFLSISTLIGHSHIPTSVALEQIIFMTMTWHGTQVYIPPDLSRKAQILPIFHLSIYPSTSSLNITKQKNILPPVSNPKLQIPARHTPLFITTCRPRLLRSSPARASPSGASHASCHRRP
jgi:hypothetical protein